MRMEVVYARSGYAHQGEPGREGSCSPATSSSRMIGSSPAGLGHPSWEARFPSAGPPSWCHRHGAAGQPSQWPPFRKDVQPPSRPTGIPGTKRNVGMQPSLPEPVHELRQASRDCREGATADGVSPSQDPLPATPSSSSCLRHRADKAPSRASPSEREGPRLRSSRSPPAPDSNECTSGSRHACAVFPARRALPGEAARLNHRAERSLTC